MAGEIIKGSVYINNIAVDGLPNTANNPVVNTIAGVNREDNVFEVTNTTTGQTSTFGDLTFVKLAVEQGKQLHTYQVTFDPNVVSGNVANIILDRISQWIGDYGQRYDDIIINMVASGGGTHDILITIVRYF